MRRTVLIIPTFDERENVEAMSSAVLSLEPDIGLLFVDDSSPDGTGDALDPLSAGNPRVPVLHRPGKLGVAGAQRDGILRAYEGGYERVITMDGDLTHSTADLRSPVEASTAFDVTVGSRFLARGSLPGWNPFRRTLTLLGHFLTHRLLGLRWDATGAFRVHRISRIPREVFARVESLGCAFFFESLFLLARNGVPIGKLPIVLPPRTYGRSRMSCREALRSFRRILELGRARVWDPGRLLVPSTPPAIDRRLVDTQGRDLCRRKTGPGFSAVSARLASLHRRLVLRTGLDRVFRHRFPAGSRLLHAGCGSGEVERDLGSEMAPTAVDISPEALSLDGRSSPGVGEVRHATITARPFPDESFDGVDNLGSMEHFEAHDVEAILSESRRVLKPGGKVVLSWPHIRGASVAVLRVVHRVLDDLLGRKTRLHPPEVSPPASRAQAGDVLRRAGLEPVHDSFGARDGFVQAVGVSRRAA